MNWSERVCGAVLGHAVGDALGVPVEFMSRAALRADPVTDMRGYGTHRQPEGTWSDDTSLMLCLLESLSEGVDFADTAGRFVAWVDKGYWTAHGRVFDLGGTTREALARLKKGAAPLEAGGDDERSNGNGSLMRILPVAFLKDLTDEEAILTAHQASSLTHRHPRSQMACGLFILLARRLLDGMFPERAYTETIKAASTLYSQPPFRAETGHFQRFLSGKLAGLGEDEIESSGYVVHTLEAAVWCVLNGSTFRETALRAVNLGDDSDTTGAVAGGLAGAWSGPVGIPPAWVEKLARRAEIEALVKRFLAQPPAAAAESGEENDDKS